MLSSAAHFVLFWGWEVVCTELLQSQVAKLPRFSDDFVVLTGCDQDACPHLGPAAFDAIPMATKNLIDFGEDAEVLKMTYPYGFSG